MPFDWMHAHVPAAVQERNARNRRAMHEDDVRIRSSLLRRLGYPQDYAVHRCLGNQQWAFELRGTPALEVGEVNTLVEAVYKR